MADFGSACIAVRSRIEEFGLGVCPGGESVVGFFLSSEFGELTWDPPRYGAAYIQRDESGPVPSWYSWSARPGMEELADTKLLYPGVSMALNLDSALRYSRLPGDENSDWLLSIGPFLGEVNSWGVFSEGWLPDMRAPVGGRRRQRPYAWVSDAVVTAYGTLIENWRLTAPAWPWNAPGDIEEAEKIAAPRLYVQGLAEMADLLNGSGRPVVSARKIFGGGSDLWRFEREIIGGG